MDDGLSAELPPQRWKPYPFDAMVLRFGARICGRIDNLHGSVAARCVQIYCSRCKGWAYGVRHWAS